MNFYTLENERLTVRICDAGAEVHSVTANGCEYIWQPESGHWQRHAPWLFPICGGLCEGRYTYRGRSFSMPKHGFVRDLTFATLEKSESAILLSISDSAETRAIYPFAFSLSVRFSLSGDRLLSEIRLSNPGGEDLYAGFGAHPGFRVPLDGKGSFDDWYLSFDGSPAPDEMVLADDLLWSGERRPFPLDGGKIKLSRAFFARDAKFLSGAGNCVTLKSDKSPRAVTVRYEGFPYVGIWSEAVDVGFVCIEPWHGLPSVSGKVDDVETKHGLFKIAPGGEERLRVEMQFL